MKIKSLLIALILLMPFALYGSAVTKPYTFTNNTVADADQVNADFDPLYAYINAHVAVVAITTHASNANISTSDIGIIECSGTTTLTLPAVANTGYVFTIVKTDATNVCTISGNDGNIEDSSTASLTTKWEKLSVVSDGTRYLVLSGTSGAN